MKKLIWSSILSLVLILSLGMRASASPNSDIIVNEDMKININGNLLDSENYSIIVNDRILVPLRDIVVNLGIENDPEHIQWDAKEQKITLIEGEKQVDLQIGNLKATVNGQTISMDVKPIIHNNRTYVPIRFVSQSLDRKVVWDQSISTALITNEVDYNKNRTIMGKVSEAMVSLNSVKADTSIKIGTSIASIFSLNVQNDASTKIDFSNKKIKTIMDFKLNNHLVSKDLQCVVTKEGKYLYNSFSQKWYQTYFNPKEYEKTFDDIYSVMFHKSNVSEAICAGLRIEDEDSDEIVFKGDIATNSLLKNISNFQSLNNKDNISISRIRNFNMEMVVDRNNYYIKSLKLSVDGIIEANKAKSSGYAKMSWNFSEYNKTFSIKEPF